MLFDQQPETSSANEDLNLLPPPELNVSMPRSLLANLGYVFLPQRLPPLQLTSRPVDVGMSVGDILELPWYRTILKNLGDAISPETLPPLQLESQPVEVELIGDQPPWWGSLLRNLADTIAPEKQPALRLTSSPVNPEMASEVLITPQWSAIIEGPKIFRRDPWVASTDLSESVPATAPLRTTFVQLPPLEVQRPDPFEHKLVLQLRRTVRRSHMREFVWISVIVAEVTTLVVLHFR